MAHTGADVGFSFSGKNPEARQAALQQGAMAIRQVADETRLAIRGLIAQGITDGIPPSRLARLIKQTIGLTARQARGVANLDTQLRRAGIRPGRVTKRVDAYRNRQLRRRARNIARTETMGALNRGKLESGRAATKAGLFNNPEKRWVITPDERLCPLCSPLANETVPLEDSFSNGLLAPPRHPQCRCTISITEADERAASADLRGTPGTAPPGLAAGAAPTPFDLPNASLYGVQATRLTSIARRLRDHGITVELPGIAPPRDPSVPGFANIPDANVLVQAIMTRHGMTSAQAHRVFVRTLLDSEIAAKAVVASGRIVPKHALRFRSDSTDVAARASGFTGPLETAVGSFVEYNVSSPWWKSAAYHKATRARLFTTKYISADAPGYYSTHEMGHVWHGQKGLRSSRLNTYRSDHSTAGNTTTWRRIKGEWDEAERVRDPSSSQRFPEPDVIQRAISNHVSEYAATNGMELVAEMYAGLVSGKTYPANLMLLYDFLTTPVAL